MDVVLQGDLMAAGRDFLGGVRERLDGDAVGEEAGLDVVARRHGAVFGLAIVMAMGPNKCSSDLGPNRHFRSIIDISGPEI